MQDEKLLSTKEAAAFLGVSDRTIQRYRRDGILVPDQLGQNNSVFYSKEQLIEVVKRLLSSGEKLIKFRPQVVTSYQQVVTSSERVVEISEIPQKCKSNRIIPAKTLVMPNDKMTETLFSLSYKEYLDVLENGGELVEVKKFHKVGDIITPYWLELINEYTNTAPLNMFARAILTACVSEWVIGNKYTTDNIIYRHITGKPSGSKPTPAIRALILHYIDKMMCTQLSVDMTEVCKHLKYNDGVSFTLKSPILPCKYVAEKINGQVSRAVIYFLDESPLLTIARIKNNQLLSVEPRLLNVSEQASSARSISICHYVIQRVLEIILHKMTPIITFKDIYQKCGLVDADYKIKHKVVHEVIEIFRYLKSGGDIQSFEVKKEGNEYQGIEFIFV